MEGTGQSGSGDRQRVAAGQEGSRSGRSGSLSPLDFETAYLRNKHVSDNYSSRRHRATNDHHTATPCPSPIATATPPSSNVAAARGTTSRQPPSQHHQRGSKVASTHATPSTQEQRSPVPTTGITGGVSAQMKAGKGSSSKGENNVGRSKEEGTGQDAAHGRAGGSNDASGRSPASKASVRAQESSSVVAGGQRDADPPRVVAASGSKKGQALGPRAGRGGVAAGVAGGIKDVAGLYRGPGGAQQDHATNRNKGGKARNERTDRAPQQGKPPTGRLTQGAAPAATAGTASQASSPPGPASSSSDAHGDGGAGGRHELTASSSSSVQLDVTDTAPRVETAKPPHQAPAPAEPAPSHSSSNAHQAEGSRSTTTTMPQETPKARAQQQQPARAPELEPQPHSQVVQPSQQPQQQKSSAQVRQPSPATQGPQQQQQLTCKQTKALLEHLMPEMEQYMARRAKASTTAELKAALLGPAAVGNKKGGGGKVKAKPVAQGKAAEPAAKAVVEPSNPTQQAAVTAPQPQQQQNGPPPAPQQSEEERKRLEEEARLAALQQAEELKRIKEEARLAALKQAEEQRRKEEEEDRLAAERARVAAEEAAAALVRELEAEEAANQARHNKKQEKRRKDKDRQRQQRQQEEQARAEALAAQEEQRRKKKEEQRQRRQQEAEMKARAEQQQEAAKAAKGAAMARGGRGGGVGPQMKDGGGVGSDGNRNKGKKEQQEDTAKAAVQAHRPQQPVPQMEVPQVKGFAMMGSREVKGAAGLEAALEQGGGRLAAMDMEDHLSCPISLVLMTDPVVAADGNTYQRDAIQAWIVKCTADGRKVTSPLSGLPMAPELKPNNLVRCLVLENFKRAGASVISNKKA